jgi:clan AA aspartic protease (TIGR02281 family)
MLATRWSIALFFMFVMGPNLASAIEFYRWVDQNGVIHFTDNFHNIPDQQRAKVGRIQAIESPKSQQPPPASSLIKASIPFEKQGQVVIVEATLNKKTAAKFIVDTGASYTMISSATAKELSIDAGQNSQTVPFQTANGLIQAPLISLQSITVGGMEISNLTAAIYDVVPDGKISGLLGLNFLSNFRMDIDIQKGLLHLEKK